jgi:hypothetical protein
LDTESLKQIVRRKRKRDDFDLNHVTVFIHEITDRFDLFFAVVLRKKKKMKCRGFDFILNVDQLVVFPECREGQAISWSRCFPWILFGPLIRAEVLNYF